MPGSTNPEPDPLDQLLNLEETFYQQGYTLGHSDGTRQGLVEGRIFGLERGFDKFFDMARLHGHSIVLGSRIPDLTKLFDKTSQNGVGVATDGLHDRLETPGPALDVELDLDLLQSHGLQPLDPRARLEKHVRTLYALTETASLSLHNGEDEVSEFDDRLKRAQAKAVILSGMVGYDIADSRSAAGDATDKPTFGERGVGKMRGSGASAGDEVGIEDTGILQARH